MIPTTKLAALDITSSSGDTMKQANDKDKSKTDKTESKPPPNEATAAPVKAAPKSFARRDHLRDIEIRMQSYWEEAKLYESNADPTTNDDNKSKFFLNFPYPYMNGRLHLGHAFSLTKAEFTARFQHLLGKNVEHM